MIEFQNSPPNWENCGTEPNNEMKKNGFKAGYKPPASIFNWFWNKTGKCIKEIQEHLSNLFDDFTNHEHSTEDVTSGTLPLKRGGTGAATAEQALKNLGITVSSALINYLSGLTSNVQTQLNSKAPSIHKHDASDTTSGTFSVNRIPNLAISKITNLQASLNAKQNNLGFTPVQQGGGTDQKSNKIYVGWTGSKLKVQVDNVDMGAIVTDGEGNGTLLPSSKVKDLPELALTVMGLGSRLLSYRKSVSIEPNGESQFDFTKGTCGFLTSVYNNGPTQVGLWHFSSGSQAVTIVPIIPNSNYEITGSISDDTMYVDVKNNSTKTQRFAAILIFNPEFTD